MTATTQQILAPETAIYNEVLPARHPWARVIKKGQILRIVDLGGNQAVDFLVYNADDPSERYSAPRYDRQSRQHLCHYKQPTHFQRRPSHDDHNC